MEWVFVVAAYLGVGWLINAFNYTSSTTSGSVIFVHVRKENKITFILAGRV